MRTIDKEVIFIYLLNLLSDTFGTVTNPLPQNKAILTGTAGVVLNCTSTEGSGSISWGFTSVGNSSRASVANGNFIYSNFKDACELSSTGIGDNNLIIKAANESLAGTYTCTDDGYTTNARAEVIVIKSDPVCTANLSSTANLEAGQIVQMSCTFSYAATSPIVSVSMIWSNGSSSPIESPVPLTTVNGVVTTANSTITQVVGYSTPFPVHQCNISFKLNPNSNTQAATNQPDYMKNSQPFPSPLQVYYFVPSCSINGIQSDGRIYRGTPIECKATANPLANYSWLHVPSGNVTRSSTILIWMDGEYQCTAWNSVGNCTISVNLTALTTTSTSTTTTTPTTSGVTSSRPNGNKGGDSSTVPTGAQTGDQNTNNIIIGVVVGVGGALLIILIIVIICCCKKKPKSESYKDGRNGNQLNDFPPPPYDGRVGPQRTSNPDFIDYPPADYPTPPRSPYDQNSKQQPYIVDDGLNYAQIQLDNQPRSRQPLQMSQNSNYTDISLA